MLWFSILVKPLILFKLGFVGCEGNWKYSFPYRKLVFELSSINSLKLLPDCPSPPVVIMQHGKVSLLCRPGGDWALLDTCHQDFVETTKIES